MIWNSEYSKTLILYQVFIQNNAQTGGSLWAKYIKFEFQVSRSSLGLMKTLFVTSGLFPKSEVAGYSAISSWWSQAYGDSHVILFLSLSLSLSLFLSFFFSPPLSLSLSFFLFLSLSLSLSFSLFPFSPSFFPSLSLSLSLFLFLSLQLFIAHNFLVHS